MTGDTVECFNCGRPNPGWAQVCRSCGVPLVATRSASTPTGPFPTDQASLLSMGAAIGAVLLAVLIGFLFSSMSPSTPTVGFQTPSPSPRASISLRPSASAGASGPVAATPVPSATPVPLPGTLTFGTALDNTTRTVSAATNSFTPQSGTFAHSIAFAEPIGADAISEEVTKVTDGVETVVQTREAGTLTVDPAATVVGYTAPMDALYADWGAGEFVMRVYRGDEKVAQGIFILNP